MLTTRDIMTTDVVTISASATVAEAEKLMKEKKLRALIVEPRSERDPYGVITETDIVYKATAFGDDSQKMRVFEICSYYLCC